MHRRIVFLGSSGPVSALAEDLRPIEGVIALAHVPGAALKPPGDLLTVDVLNRSADDVLRRAQTRAAAPGARLTIVLSQSTAIVDAQRQHLLESDADEAQWEEMESDLRNHGRLSANYVVLMALGGIIAAAALFLQSSWRTIGFVAASIIAPAFEPVAKLTQGLILRKLSVARRAMLSIAVGYAVLFAASFATIEGLRLAHPGQAERLPSDPVLHSLTRLESAALVSSASAAIAGILMVVSLRDLYVVGPLMALVILPGIALAAAGAAIGDSGVALGALRQVGVDLLLIIVLGGGVFAWKQYRFHRRRPLT